MTTQEIFDKVAEHLLKQGKKSRHEERELCLYRGPEGLMCAAGCLIPDGLYDPQMEDQTWKNVVLKFDLPAYLETDQSVELVGELQDCHDLYDVCDWREKLAFIASAHNLEFKYAES